MWKDGQWKKSKTNATLRKQNSEEYLQINIKISAHKLGSEKVRTKADSCGHVKERKCGLDSSRPTIGSGYRFL